MKSPISSRFGKVRNMAQVVYTGMLGSLVVLSIAAFVLMGKLPLAETLPSEVLFIAGGVLSVVCAAMAVILPRLMIDRIPKKQVALRLNGYAYSRIVLAALLEAAGLFWAVTGLLTSTPLCLIGPGVAIAMLLTSFPTQGRFEATLELNEVETDRALGYQD